MITQENPTDGGTILGNGTTDGGTLMGDIGDAASGTGGSDPQVGFAGISSTGGDASLDGAGTPDSEHSDNVFESATVSEEPADYTPGWPKIYTMSNFPVPMLSYFATLPATATVIAEINSELSVANVLELAREHGFSAKSILNHMVDMGYEFKSADEANQYGSLDY